MISGPEELLADVDAEGLAVAATGDVASFVIISSIVMLSIAFDFVQEVRAQNAVEALRRQASAHGVAVTEIGTVAAGQGQARFVDARGKPLVLAHPSFSHF